MDSQVSHYFSYLESKSQLKWNGNTEQLLQFLASELHIKTCNFQVSDNGSCGFFKTAHVTYNFYHKTKTLQVQDRLCAEELKRNFIELATKSNQTETITSTQPPLHEDLHSEAQDGGQLDISSLEVSDRFISEMEPFETSQCYCYRLYNVRASCGCNDGIMKLWEAVNNLKLAATDTPGYEIVDAIEIETLGMFVFISRPPLTIWCALILI